VLQEYGMNLIDEVDALKKTIEILNPLGDEARLRVLNYAYQAFGAPSTNRPKVATLDALSKVSGGAPLPAGGSFDKPKSPQEYLRTYNYKIMTKRIAVMAVFLERERGKKRFSLRDITEVFRDAKEPKTPAHSQYGRAQAMDFIAKEGDQFYATSKAEALVDSYNANNSNGENASEAE
jgi:hypothetical protein